MRKRIFSIFLCFILTFGATGKTREVDAAVGTITVTSFALALLAAAGVTFVGNESTISNALDDFFDVNTLHKSALDAMIKVAPGTSMIDLASDARPFILDFLNDAFTYFDGDLTSVPPIVGTPPVDVLPDFVVPNWTGYNFVFDPVHYLPKDVAYASSSSGNVTVFDSDFFLEFCGMGRPGQFFNRLQLIVNTVNGVFLVDTVGNILPDSSSPLDLRVTEILDDGASIITTQLRMVNGSYYWLDSGGNWVYLQENASAFGWATMRPGTGAFLYVDGATYKYGYVRGEDPRWGAVLTTFIDILPQLTAFMSANPTIVPMDAAVTAVDLPDYR